MKAGKLFKKESKSSQNVSEVFGGPRELSTLPEIEVALRSIEYLLENYARGFNNGLDGDSQVVLIGMATLIERCANSVAIIKRFPERAFEGA